MRAKSEKQSRARQARPKQTWTQEALAIRTHQRLPREHGFFTSEKRAMLLLAAKTALAAGICYGIAKLAGLQDGYWGSISAIIVLQSNVGSTVTASRDRLIGTLIGAAFGGAFSLLDEGIWAYLIAVIAAMVTCSLLGLKNSSRLAGVTVTIILLVHRTGSNWTLPLHRVLEVLLGIVVALAISALVFPSRARTRLQEGLAQEFLLLGAHFGAVTDQFTKGQSPSLAQLRKDVEAALAANGVLLVEARNEPSGGPATLEGLSLVEQYGRGLSDLLHALELAVAGCSAEASESYRSALHPELERLIADIHHGFEWVARCIHRWSFSTAPRGFSLEEDLTALEHKIAAIDRSSHGMPQVDLLHGYAVQLHLMQLARLLRAARIETGRTVGA